MGEFKVGDVVILNDNVTSNILLKPMLKQQFMQYSIGKPYNVFEHDGKPCVLNDYGNTVKVSSAWFRKLSPEEIIIANLLFS